VLSGTQRAPFIKLFARARAIAKTEAASLSANVLIVIVGAEGATPHIAHA
jgi:hypothetical protein